MSLCISTGSLHPSGHIFDLIYIWERPCWVYGQLSATLFILRVMQLSNLPPVKCSTLFCLLLSIRRRLADNVYRVRSIVATIYFECELSGHMQFGLLDRPTLSYLPMRQRCRNRNGNRRARPRFCSVFACVMCVRYEYAAKCHFQKRMP